MDGSAVVLEGDTFDLDAGGSEDPADGGLVYRWSVDGPAVAVGGTAVSSAAAPFTAVGSRLVLVAVQDGIIDVALTVTDERSMVFPVIVNNGAPTVEPPGDHSLAVGVVPTLSLKVVDPVDPVVPTGLRLPGPVRSAPSSGVRRNRSSPGRQQRPLAHWATSHEPVAIRAGWPAWPCSCSS